LLLEANADWPEFEKARGRFRERADRLLEANSSEQFHGTWRYGFASLYAFERSLREGKAHPALERIARVLVAEQNSEGGWNHNKNFAKQVPIYSRSLNAVTNLVLINLGAAERMKVPFASDEKFKKAVTNGLTLLQQCQAKDGGIMYGKERKGDEKSPFKLVVTPHPGRTAGLLPGLAAVKQADSDLFRRAAGYALRGMESVPQGEADTSLHIFMGALAFYVLSDDAFGEYDTKILDQVRKLQRKEGDFNKGTFSRFTGPGPGLTDRAHVASFYALALCVDRLEVARTLKLSTPFKLPAVEK
jgi:hypothetical protein